VPVKQIEGEGLLAEQVIVDHERPDQVVRAQEAEGLLQFSAFENTFFRHFTVHESELFIVDKQAQIAGILEIDQGGEEGRGGDLFFTVLRLKEGQRYREQRAAQAVADCVRIFFTRDGLYLGKGFKHAL